MCIRDSVPPVGNPWVIVRAYWGVCVCLRARTSAYVTSLQNTPPCTDRVNFHGIHVFILITFKSYQCKEVTIWLIKWIMQYHKILLHTNFYNADVVCTVRAPPTETLLSTQLFRLIYYLNNYLTISRLCSSIGKVYCHR